MRISKVRNGRKNGSWACDAPGVPEINKHKTPSKVMLHRQGRNGVPQARKTKPVRNKSKKESSLKKELIIYKLQNK